MKKNNPLSIQLVMREAADRLAAPLGNQDQAWNEAEILMAHALKHDRAWVLAHATESLAGATRPSFARLLKRRLAHEPMAYILGRTTFHGREFLSRRGALIPRPETEDLVRRALETIRRFGALHVLAWDVGVGSGAIAVSVKAGFPQTRVVASDVSATALALARVNAKRLLGDASAIAFMRADLLSPSMEKIIAASPHEALIVLANLPYLPLADKKRLAPDVVKYEPSQALFTKEEGNFLLHRLMKQLRAFQKKDGRPFVLLAELDPPQSKKLFALAKSLFPRAPIFIHQDSCGRDRLLEVRTN
jgi:release factor glutamine methyltransferase